MSEIKIPISVDLGSSAAKLKTVQDGLKGVAQNATEFATSAKQASSTLQTAFAGDTTKSLKQQLRDARNELDSLIARFGQTGPGVAEAAARVDDLTDAIAESKRVADTADLEGKFVLAGRAIQGLAGGFQTVTALQGLFGEKSKATEEALKKVQAALALTQGIDAIIQGGKAFGTLAASIFKTSNLVKIYTAGQVVAAFVTRLFGAAVNSTSVAFKGLAVAIASTGIGLLVVGIGLLVSKIIEWTSSTDENEKAQKGLNDELERQKRIIDDEIESIDFVEKLSIQNARARGASEKELTNIIEDQNAKRLAALKKASEDAADLAANASKIRKADPEEQKKFNEASIAANRAYLAELARQDLAEATKRGDAREKADKEQADKEKERREEALRKSKENAQKRARAVEEAQKLQRDIEISLLNDTQQKLARIELEYSEKRKKLKAGGITNFTALEQAQAKEIQGVIDQSNKDALQARANFNKLLENEVIKGLKRSIELQQQASKTAKETNDLIFRAQISGIKDQYEKRKQELTKAEQDEIDALDEAYRKKEFDFEEYWKRLEAIRQFYSNQQQENRDKSQEDELKRIEDFQKTIADTVASATEALTEALVSGADPFQAVFKSLAESLGSYLQDLGKKAILASEAIKKIKILIGTPQGLVAGIALVALGTAIKAAFNKKTSKGFASGGFVSGPGSEKSDSIPARLSNGEYVINARSVRTYGRGIFDQLNRQNPSADLLALTRSFTRNGGTSKALVNRFDSDLSNALGALKFSEGGLVEATRQFTRNSGSSKALVNRFDVPSIPNVTMTESFQREVPYIATTRISGQDLKLVLERADRRFSNAT